jgi:hypothetical protein
MDGIQNNETRNTRSEAVHSQGDTMMNRRSVRNHALVLAAVAGLLLAPASAVSAANETHRFDAEHLEVRNLIGEVRVESHAGSDFEVEVAVAGRDAEAGLIRVDTRADGLDVRFPGGHSEFVYPALGPNAHSSINTRGSDQRDLFYGTPAAGDVEIRGSGKGLELWVDLTIRVPDGGRLELSHGVGAIRVDGVDGALELASQSGTVEVSRVSGELSAGTGSGDIVLSQSDTERTEIGTGSGNVRIEQCRGGSFDIGAGSGNVTIDGLTAREVEIGTGSGNVRAGAMEVDEADIGTGSGELAIDLFGVVRGKYEIGAGSGDIRLGLESGADATVHAETSSGEIDLRLGREPSYQLREKEEVRFTLGSGSARIEVGTGSGDITIEG